MRFFVQDLTSCDDLASLLLTFGAVMEFMAIRLRMFCGDTFYWASSYSSSKKSANV